MRTLLTFLLLFLACSLCACEDVTASGAEHRDIELVMSDGMTVAWDTPSGEMSVFAGPGLKRTYTWGGASRDAELWPRRKRWYGSLGIYFPGPGNHWAEHDGVRRGVLEEGQQHFSSLADAIAWLDAREGGSRLWTSSGVVVEWDFVPIRNQLNVEVWQLLIDGAPPTSLAGARDDAIRISYPPTSAIRPADVANRDSAGR